MSDPKRNWFSEIVSIAVCCLIVYLSLWGYDTWKQHRRAIQAVSLLGSPLQVGSTVSLDGADFSRSPVNFIVVVSPVCKYCLASETFHSNWLKIARTANVPVYVAVPSKKEASQYLKGLGVSDDSAREYKQLKGFVSGTPTIVGVDSTGRVVDLWAGLATPADESDVVDITRARSFSAGKESTKIDAPNYQPRDLLDLKAKTDLSVIDLRERDKINKENASVNIPLEELPFRAAHELNQSALQIVDCTNIGYDQCAFAVKTLKNLKFNTATLGAGTYRLRCQLSPISG
jgi:hypothetical protein